MKIEVLGTGCARCMTLYENVKDALKELGKEVEVVKVQDTASIMKYGVMSMPSLVIDGKVRFSRTAPGVAGLKGTP
jgi:small redox-active disulfide protein 2